MKTPLRILLFGATGMVGEGVLHECLLSEDVASVTVIGRRSCGVQHPKLDEILHADFFDYSSLQDRLSGFDACLFCLGVTSIGKKEDEYTRLTHDLTMRAGEALAGLNPSMTFCYVSGLGTDGTESGRSMWARVKGRTENDLSRLPFRAVYHFRPGFIKPTKGLRNAHGFAVVLGATYPVLRLLFRQYVTTMEELGRAMIRVAKDGYADSVLECADIVKAAEA